MTASRDREETRKVFWQPRVLGFLSCLALIFMRGWERVVQADLFGEDAVYVEHALHDGAGSFLHPYAGTFVTLPRLIIWFALKFFPLAWLPTIICLACYLLAAWIFSIICRRDYAWLIPSELVRMAIALLFCLAPGTPNVLGNVCDVNWILILWVALIYLKDPQLSLTRGDFFALGLTLISTGTYFVLIPLFFWRFLYSPRDRFSNSLSIVLLFAYALMNSLVVRSSSPIIVHPLHQVASGSVNYFFRGMVFQPWLGDQGAAFIGNRHIKFWEGCLRFLFLIAGILWLRKQRPLSHNTRVLAILSFTLGLFSWTAVTCYFRHDGLDRINMTDFSYHYSFPAGFTAILIWTAVFYSCMRKERAFALSLIFLVGNAVLSHYRFPVPAYGAARYWDNTVALLEQSLRTGSPKEVRVSTYPEGWYLHFSASRPYEYRRY